MIKEYDEGGDCPHCDGVLEIYNERGCTCFIVAPCSACVDSVLRCDKCEWETDSTWMDEVDDSESQVMEFI